MAEKKGKITFVNIIFFVIFGVLTGVLWAFASPIPLVPGQIHFRTFAFLIVCIGFMYGPVTGFFSGYIGTLVWSLIAGYFIPLHSPLTDGIMVGLSAAVPAWIMLKQKPLDKWLETKGKFIGWSLFWSILSGIVMIFASCASLSYFAGTPYWYNVLMMGIADIAPIALTPFVVILLAPRMKKLNSMVPFC